MTFPVPQDAVEAGMLAAVRQDMKLWLTVRQFTTEDFVAHREVFLFMDQYLAQYGSLPSNDQIGTRFQWSPPIGDFPYWLAEMKRYSLARQVTQVMIDGQKRIATPDEALGFMLEKLATLRSLNTNHISAMDSRGGERLQKFDARTEYIFNGKNIIGTRTGHKLLDGSLMGWIPGSLIGAYARPGVGKTWWLLWQGAMNWYDGGTVLAITPEMPANWLDLRCDVVIGNMLGYQIDYAKLIVGDPSIRPNYEKVTQILNQSQRWWTYDSFQDRPIGISEIYALTKLHNPSIVLIDGASLIRPEGRGQTWEQMKTTIYGLKNFATIQEVPVIVTHQAVNVNRGSKKEYDDARGDDFHMPSLNDAAYGDSFVGACSDVITFAAEPTSKNVNWYRFAKHRERAFQQQLPSRMGLVVDFGTGRIFDVGNLGYDPLRVGEEARRLLG